MTTTIMPSIALPTGPFDLDPLIAGTFHFEDNLAGMRAAMKERGATHAVVHGNGFDHSALLWLTHFTPKLGPAYALVPAEGPLRLLFAGGPGMKPSAQKLTWVEDVVALRGIEADVKRWLAEASNGAAVRLGLVEGSAMLYGDWKAVQRAAGGSAVELDEAVQRRRDVRDFTRDNAFQPASIAADVASSLAQIPTAGREVRSLLLAQEGFIRQGDAQLLRAGVQDVRWRVGIGPGARLGRLPDEPVALTGPVRVEMSVRDRGAWATLCFVLEPHRES